MKRTPALLLAPLMTGLSFGIVQTPQGHTILHKPLEAGQCFPCHDPHGGATRTLLRGETYADMCRQCHADVMAPTRSVHGPAASDNCGACHSAHGSSYPMILNQTGDQVRLPCHPTRPQSRHRAVARLLREKGLFDSAQRELRTALNLNPNNVECQLDLAPLLIVVDRIDDARKIIDAILYRNAEDRQAQLLRAVVLYREDRFEEAEPLFLRLLVLNPDPARTHYYLARIYEQQGEKDKALHHYHEALIRFIGDEIG